MIVVGKMRKWNPAILAGTARVVSLLAAERRPQASNLGKAVEPVYHSGRKQWTVRREEIPKLFDFSMLL
jgi:hypothetical protein